MKRIALSFCLVLLGQAMIGCKSYGPRFAADQPGSTTERKELLSQERLRLAPIEESRFLFVASTNEFDSRWLQPPTDFFRLGPGDVLEVETLGEAESRANALVGPDGKLYYTFLPGVFVWGATLTEAKQALEKEMAKYLRVQPEIAVTLRTVGSKRLWVLGSVQTPGLYTLNAPVTVLEAISAAGGTLPDAGMAGGIPNLDYSFVLRDGKMIRVDFARLLRHGDLSQNIYLRPDDFLYLRPGIIRNIYVLGAVAAPTVVPYSDQISLGAVIAQAGGTVEYAYKGNVAVVRGSLSNPRVAIVDYGDILKGKAADAMLGPGDIVFVPFVPYRRLAIFAEEILRQFVSTIAVNEGYRAVVPGFTGTTPTVPIGGGTVPFSSPPSTR